MKIDEVIQKYQSRVRKDMSALFRRFPDNEDIIVRRLDAGAVMLAEGTATKCVYILLTGTLKLSWELPGRDKYIFTIKDPLIFMGDLAIMAQLPEYTTTVTAATVCEAIFLTRGQFWHWMDEDPLLFRQLASENLNKLLQQSVVRRTAEEKSSYIRMLTYFRWYYLMYHDTNTNCAIVKRTRDQMAEDISLISVRTINRILDKLQDDGLISIVKGKININEAQYRAILRELE
ncbi:MAG: Crp/Fnr family transcriptional regulator [Christensenella sp.]|nr:Crp/Fnr family transcriptional regulator [Christensenella sp.]